LEPAEEDPEDEKDEDAPGPEPPADVLVWIYRSCSLPGPCWELGAVSRITWYWFNCVYMVLIWRCP
jgi:hypothetical protein